jgi:hypothetical protein
MKRYAWSRYLLSMRCHWSTGSSLHINVPTVRLSVSRFLSRPFYARIDLSRFNWVTNDSCLWLCADVNPEHCSGSSGACPIWPNGSEQATRPWSTLIALHQAALLVFVGGRHARTRVR